MGRPWLSTRRWSSMMVAVLLVVNESRAVVPEGHRSRRAMKAVRDRASGHSSDDGEAKTPLASQTQVGPRRSETARGDDSFAQQGQVDGAENDEAQSVEQQESRPAAESDESVEQLLLEEEGSEGEEEMKALVAKRAPPQASGPGAAAIAASVRSPSLANSRTSAHIAPASRVRSDVRLGATTSTRKKLRTAAHAGTRTPASGGSSLDGSDGGKVRAQEIRRSTGLQPAQGAVPRTVQFRKTVSTPRQSPSGSVEEEEPGNVASLRVEDIEEGREGVDRPTMDEGERESRAESDLGEDNGDGKSDGVGAQPVGPEGSNDMQGEDAVEQEQDAVSDQLVEEKASTARKDMLKAKGKMPAASLARPGAADSSTADRVESNEPGKVNTPPGPEVVAHVAEGAEEPAVVAKKPSVTATEEQGEKVPEEGFGGRAQEGRLVKVADEGRAQEENREQQPLLQQAETEEDEEKGTIGGEQRGAQEGETTTDVKRTKGMESVEDGPLKHGAAKGHISAGRAGMTEAGSRPLSGGDGVDVAETVKGGDGVTKPSASASLPEDKPVQDVSVQPALEGDDELKKSAKVRRTAAVSKLRRRPDVDDDATIPSNTLRRSKVYGRPVQKEQELLKEPDTKKQTSSAEYATTTGPVESRRTMPALSKAERIRPARMGVLAGTAVEEAQEGQPEGDVEFDNLDVEARASTQQAQPIDAANRRTISTKSKDAMSAAAQGQRETPHEENRQAGGSDELGLAEEDQDEGELEDGEDDFDMEEAMEDEGEHDLEEATMPDLDAKSVKQALPTTAEKGEDAQELVNLNDSKQTLTLSKSKAALGAAAQGKKEAPWRADDIDEGDSNALLGSAKSTEEEFQAEDGEDEADAEPFWDEDEMEEGDGEAVVRKKAVMGGKHVKQMLPRVAERGDIVGDELVPVDDAKERTRSSTRKSAARAGAHAGKEAKEGPGREADDNEELYLDQILNAGKDDHDEADAQQREHELGAEIPLEEEEGELLISKQAKLEAKPAKQALPKVADNGKSVHEEPASMDGGRDKTTSSKSKDALRATASGKKVAAETQDTQAEDDEEVDLDEILQMVEDADEDEAEGEEADAEGFHEPEEDELPATKFTGKALSKAGGKVSADDNEPSAEGSNLRQKEKGALNTVKASATESGKPDSSKAPPSINKTQQGKRSGSKLVHEGTEGVRLPSKKGGDGADVEEEGEGDDLSTLQTAFELPSDDEQEDGEAPSAAKTGKVSAQPGATKNVKKSRGPLAGAEDDTTLLTAAVSLLANDASATEDVEEDPIGKKDVRDASRPGSEAGTTTPIEKGKGAAREKEPKVTVVDTSKVPPKAHADPAREDGGDTGEPKEASKGLPPDTSRPNAVGGKGPAGPAGRANVKDRTAPPDGKSPSTPVTAAAGKKGVEEKKGDESAPPQPDGPKATPDSEDDTKKAANGGPIGAGGPKGQPRGADSGGERGKESADAPQPPPGQPGKQQGPSDEEVKKAAQPATAPIQPKETATVKPREDAAVDTGKPQEDPLLGGQGAVVRPPPSTDNTNKAPEVVKDTKKAKAEVKAKATTTCDPTKTCHGHGTCDDDGRCLCRAPWSGPSCLHNNCVDFEDCEGCVTSTVPGGTALLGCYWQDDECRGDGLYAPDMESCSGIGTWARIWSYLQYAVIGFVVVGFASLLIVRSRRPGGFTLFRNITTGYQPIPMNGGARGQQGREDWNWDPEEDNVELLATSGQGDEARPEPYTDKPPQQQQPAEKHNGIYSMIKTPAVEKSTKDTSAGPPVSTSTTASTNKPSSIGDDDIFAELGMEVVPSFKTSPTAHSPRESASAGPSAASGPTGRSNRLGVSPIKTSVRDEEAGAEDQAAGWNDDDDIDGILDA